MWVSGGVCTCMVLLVMQPPHPILHQHSTKSQTKIQFIVHTLLFVRPPTQERELHTTVIFYHKTCRWCGFYPWVWVSGDVVHPATHTPSDFSDFFLPGTHAPGGFFFLRVILRLAIYKKAKMHFKWSVRPFGFAARDMRVLVAEMKPHNQGLFNGVYITISKIW